MSTQFNCQKTFLFQAIQFKQTVLIQTIQFSLSTVSMSKTVLFQAVRLSISTQFSSIWPIDRTWVNGNERVLCIRQSSSIAETSTSDCLVSYPRYSLEAGGVLPLCRGAVSVFYGWRMKRKRKKKKHQKPTERGNPWLELSYSLNPPLGDTISNRLSYYSLTTVFNSTLYLECKEPSANPNYALLL